MFGSKGAYVIENAQRVGSVGKSALLCEVVDCVPSSALITIYNSNGTAYTHTSTGGMTLATTGAAILTDIKKIKSLHCIQLLATGAATTTTQLRPIAATIINGPTTAVKVFVNGFQAGGSIRITIFGQS
jgi:pyridoxal/pyridoxine/pyridoxamine kinase